MRRLCCLILALVIGCAAPAFATDDEWCPDDTTTTTTTPPTTTVPPPVVVPEPARCTWPAAYHVGFNADGSLQCSTIDPCIDSDGNGHGALQWGLSECFTTEAARLWVTTVRQISATYGTSIAAAEQLLIRLLNG
jgi:hypothetical protein